MPEDVALLEQNADFEPLQCAPRWGRRAGAADGSLAKTRGFSLFFAVTNSAPERNRRMESVIAELGDQKVQRVAVHSANENLLWHLRETLTDPRPDAVFVYGLENWVSGAVPPRTIDFLINLNAARDSFPNSCPPLWYFGCPTTFCKPSPTPPPTSSPSAAASTSSPSTPTNGTKCAGL